MAATPCETGPVNRLLGCLQLLTAMLALGCRIERVSPHQSSADSSLATPQGELWVYTSMYRAAIDALEPHFKTQLPAVQLQWFQSGSEKVASRLDAELAGGGTQADVLMTSDPFLYQRLKDEGKLLPYASPYSLRIPRTLVDLDANFVACRISTMLLVHASDMKDPPTSFEDLTKARYAGKVAIGDALTSGTAATWALFMHHTYGPDYFTALRANRAVVAGGNAAVLQKVESGEVQVGVLLLENALSAVARGSRITVVYPKDGAVVIPGFVAILASSKNPVAAKAFVDSLLSTEGQRGIVERGDMHSVDERLAGPKQQPTLATLLSRSMAWSPEMLSSGVKEMPKVKAVFAKAFGQ